MLSSEASAHFGARLIDRRSQLRGAVQDGNERRTGEDRYSELASEVPDAADASVANEQADLRRTRIERDVGELEAVDAALLRIKNGTYGECTACLEAIPSARLDAEPTAERCVHCQGLFESRHHAPGGGTL